MVVVTLVVVVVMLVMLVVVTLVVVVVTLVAEGASVGTFGPRLAFFLGVVLAFFFLGGGILVLYYDLVFIIRGARIRVDATTTACAE